MKMKKQVKKFENHYFTNKSIAHEHLKRTVQYYSSVVLATIISTIMLQLFYDSKTYQLVKPKLHIDHGNQTMVPRSLETHEQNQEVALVET